MKDVLTLSSSAAGNDKNLLALYCLPLKLSQSTRGDTRYLELLRSYRKLRRPCEPQSFHIHKNTL